MTAGQILGFCRSHWADLAVAALLLLVTAGIGFCIFRLSTRQRGPRRAPLSDETGGLSEEMVLVFPIFLFFLAMTVQVILLLNARLMVNYAAFVAGRSASVWIPARTSSEISNSMQLTPPEPNANPPDPGSSLNVSALTQSMTQSPSGSLTEKYDRIHGAAALACAPISPNYFGFLSEVIPGFGGLYASASGAASQLLNGVPGMPQTIASLAPRWIYARKFTTVYFRDDPAARMYTFGPADDIKITVEHKFHLGVPWVSRALAVGGMAHLYYPAWETGLFSLGWLKSRVYYATIQESYVFHNEGERLAPGYGR